MNAAKTKFLTWLVAGTLGVGLCLFVIFNLQRLDEARTLVSTDRMTQVLSDTPAIVEKADDIVPYPSVESALIAFNWTGEPPPPPPDREKPVVPPAPTELGVDQLVKLLGYRVDGRNPEDSSVILKYLPEARVPAPSTVDPNHIGILKHPGEALDAPVAHVKVLSITAGGVEFGFDDGGREPETLETEDYSLEGPIVRVDGDEIISATAPIFIPKGTLSRHPKRTESIGRGRYRIGTDDARHIGENYAQILSQDVRTARHKDPRTGRYDGIEIKSVAPGSVAERHGTRTGDVIKSINGHSVTSTPEAINFVKNNAEMFDSWKIVVENMGRERTVTYYPPQE